MWNLAKNTWNLLFAKQTSTEKDAILNVKILYKKYGGNEKRKFSKPERMIYDILVKKGYPFCREYSFEDLIGTIKPLRFDFALVYKERLYLIEYQGSQHYIFPNTFHKNKEDFETQRRRDEQKKEYCKKHGIKLIQITYLQNNIIEELLNEHFPP